MSPLARKSLLLSEVYRLLEPGPVVLLAARGGSKSAQILDLLKRPGGAVGIFRWVFPLACGAETSVHGPVVDGHGEERALWKQRY